MKKISSIVTKVGYYLTYVAVLTACITYILGEFSTFNSDPHHGYHKQKELNYWEAKAQLVRSVQEYIDQNSSHSALSPLVLLEMCEKYDVDIRFVLAQAHVESHFGTKGLAARTNSVWNVGAYDGLNDSQISRRFKYDHPDDSIEPYLRLLKKRYLIEGKTEMDLVKKYVSSDGKRYATYQNYEQEIQNKLQNMTQIDSCLSEYHYMKLTLNR